MIKYLFLLMCTIIALLIKDYIASVGIYVAGLLIYEVLVVLSFLKKRKHENISNTNNNI